MTITGEGTIDANAQNGDWYQNPKKNTIAWRPRLFFTSGAKNVVLHGVLVCNSYSWTIHPTYSENVDILNIRIRNSSTSPNTDGIDPESCKNVNIIGNHVHVGDDCIALKSGKLFLGMKLHVPCENIIIRNCCLSRGHGGLVIGSEMSGRRQERHRDPVPDGPYGPGSACQDPAAGAASTPSSTGWYSVTSLWMACWRRLSSTCSISATPMAAATMCRPTRPCLSTR